MQEMQETWEVEPEMTPAGWRVRCPLCSRPVEAATHRGVVQATCDHMNLEHFRPPRGNA